MSMWMHGESKNPWKSLMNKKILDVRNLKVIFRTEEGIVPAVDGVSFAAFSGKTLGLVGESGCGKSVSALSVIRLIPDPPGKITDGEIIWKGTDLLKMPDRKWTDIRGRRIAMIFQEPMTSLNPVFTVGRQLGEVLSLRFGLKGEKAEKRIIEMLDFVGISDPSSRIQAFPHELSGGMMQRIMIAMALLTEPDLLIADEPTTALDVTIQAQILRLIKNIQKKNGMAVILITHDMGVVAETCDHVSVMYAGRIVETGGVRDIFERPLHPYTSGLLRSIPQKGSSREKPLPTIEGTVPSMLDLPGGCRFSPRCFRRKEMGEKDRDQCTTHDPGLRSIGEDRGVACHFPLEGSFHS